MFSNVITREIKAMMRMRPGMHAILASRALSSAAPHVLAGSCTRVARSDGPNPLCGKHSLPQEKGQPSVRILFVTMHEPGIAGYVGGQDSRRPPLNSDWPLLHHGWQSNPAILHWVALV